MIEGADHEDLYAYAHDEYEQKVLAFLNKYLPITLPQNAIHAKP